MADNLTGPDMAAHDDPLGNAPPPPSLLPNKNEDDDDYKNAKEITFCEEDGEQDQVFEQKQQITKPSARTKTNASRAIQDREGNAPILMLTIDNPQCRGVLNSTIIGKEGVQFMLEHCELTDRKEMFAALSLPIVQTFLQWMSDNDMPMEHCERCSQILDFALKHPEMCDNAPAEFTLPNFGCVDLDPLTFQTLLVSDPTTHPHRILCRLHPDLERKVDQVLWDCTTLSLSQMSLDSGMLGPVIKVGDDVPIGSLVKDALQDISSVTSGISTIARLNRLRQAN